MPHHLLLKGSTLWVLNGHFDPPESGLEALSKSGSATIEVSDFLLTPALVEQISKRRLGLIIQAYPLASEDIDSTIAFAKQTKAVAINTHIRTPHIDHDDAVKLLGEIVQRANDAGVTLYCETHRNCITQDIYRAARLADAVPDARFTLDVSHYVLCGEQPGPTAAFSPLIDPILDRVGMIHGRISNGQQIQEHTVSHDSELALRYRAFWAEAMRRWRMRNAAGSSLIFTPELGPPPYAVTDSNGKELSNRLEQREIIWNLAQAAWKDSAKAGKESLWP